MLLALSLLTFVVWVYLVAARGRFWTTRRAPLPDDSAELGARWPAVLVVVPARNESTVIAETVRRILGQDYRGSFRLVVVDDHSGDETAASARAAAAAIGRKDQLTVYRAPSLPPGWTGKLWAMHRGAGLIEDAAFIWFTDADIWHAPGTLRQLVARAEADRRDLVSRMALLRTNTIWEVFMIPAFVYFFQLLYPFSLSNRHRSKTAAAAGGCILLRRTFWEQIGGVSSIRDALIDDCALAKKVKSAGGSLWLELTRDSVSARGYDGFCGLWNMIARTAYTQLGYQPFLLVGCILGLSLTFLAPALLPWGGLASGRGLAAVLGLASWLLMTASFVPMTRFYFPKRPVLAMSIALALPGTAVLYLGATIHSAIRYHRGAGGRWKGRSQAPPTR